MVIPIGSGKTGRDLAAGEHRARRAVAIGRVLVGDQIALPGAFLAGAYLERVGARRPEIGVAAEDNAVAQHDNAAGPASDAVTHQDVHRVESVLPFLPSV